MRSSTPSSPRASRWTSTRYSWAELFVDAADAEVLHFEELFDPVLGALAADTGLLDAAERRDLVGNNSDVDADHAVLERLGNAPDAPDVAAVEIGRETVFGIVGKPDQLLLGLEAEQRRHRTERLLMGPFHFGLAAGGPRRQDQHEGD